MNILKLSNTFKLLVDSSQHFQGYRYGYPSDININWASGIDPNNEAGKMFPLVFWAQPAEGKVSIRNGSHSDQIDVTLLFYDLQGLDNMGNETYETLAETWNRLKRLSIEFLHAFQDLGAFSITDRSAKWFLDSNLHVDRLVCVGLEFTVFTPYNCDDYQTQTPALGHDLVGITINCDEDLTNA